MSENFATASRLIRSLIATRANRKERLEKSDVRDAIETIGRHVEDAPLPSLRLEATSLLGKAGESFNSKLLTTLVTDVMDRGLSKPLPPIGDWGNADDRRYLAKALVLSRAEWIPKYAAEALATAEISEKVSRDIWAELAVTRAEDLATALHTIARAVADWLASREDAIEFSYRKLRRICDALSQTLLTADVPSGREFGNAFAALTRVAGGGKGVETRKAREEAAISVLDLLIQILRLRFDVLFDSDIYRAVGAVRGWWGPGRPPDGIESRTDRIAHLAMDGLHILARQGVRDKELRQALKRSLDSDRVNSVGQAIAAKDLSLDPKSSRFLATGQDLAEVQTTETIQELSDQATDELLGRLLLTVTNQEVSATDMTAVANAIDLFEPAQASLVRKASSRLELIQQWVNALASKRRLATYSSRGELVQYDPALHDAADTLQRLRQVRVSVPGVVKSVEARPPAIIIKAIVERL